MSFSSRHSCLAKAGQDSGLQDSRADHKSKACSLLHRQRESLVPQDMRSPLPQANESSRITVTSLLSSASYKERPESLANSYLKRDLFDPSEDSQNGEGH